MVELDCSMSTAAIFVSLSVRKQTLLICHKCGKIPIGFVPTNVTCWDAFNKSFPLIHIQHVNCAKVSFLFFCTSFILLINCTEQLIKLNCIPNDPKGIHLSSSPFNHKDVKILMHFWIELGSFEAHYIDRSIICLKTQLRK